MLPLSDASSQFALACTRLNPENAHSNHDRPIRSFGIGAAPISLGSVSPAHPKSYCDKQIQGLNLILPRDLGRARETVRAVSRSSSANSMYKNLIRNPSQEEPTLAAGEKS